MDKNFVILAVCHKRRVLMILINKNQIRLPLAYLDDLDMWSNYAKYA